MAEIKTLDKEGYDFIAKEEGIVLHPYLDSVGIPTIGIGMTYYPGTGKKVTMSDPTLSTEQAYALFSQIAKPFEFGIYSITRDDINQHQFNALFSIAYNIGISGFRGSTLHKLVNNNPNDPAIKDAFLMWSKAGKDKTALLGRRKREADLYFKK